MTHKNVVRILCALATTASLFFATSGGSASRPRPGECECANAYIPVKCSDGIVYYNPCVAACAGATDCEPYGTPDDL
jgi:hypothetical protein